MVGNKYMYISLSIIAIILQIPTEILIAIKVSSTELEYKFV